MKSSDNDYNDLSTVSRKVVHITCGAMVLPMTAEKFDGLCAQCAKLVENPPDQPPAAIAYRLAAAFLALNAATTAYITFVTESAGINSLAILVDSVLAVLLIRLYEGARLLTTIRAALGFVVIALATFLATNTQQQWYTLIFQGVFSGGILLLLIGETTSLKLWIGGICLAVVAAIFGMTALGIAAA